MPEFAPGDVFVDHRIEGLAGRGGMGVVYRATDIELERVVALKVITPALAEEEDFRRRFVAESKAAASIEHPNVIPVYYAGQREGVLYIVMRYIDGPDLRALVRAQGKLEPERAAHIVAQVAAALDAAHAHGLVHRDVKPANVLLSGKEGAEHVYLTDFGLTKNVSSSSAMTRTGAFVGTLDYVAPEQLKGTAVDGRADVYALGCVLYELLTGTVPFERDSDVAKIYAHTAVPPPRPSAVVPTLPAAFDAVVGRAMDKDREERYPTAGELAAAARAVLAGEAAPAPTLVPAPTLPPAPTLAPAAAAAEAAARAETALLRAATPPDAAPPGSTPTGSTPAGSTPPGSWPPGSVPPGSTPPGSTPPGSVPPGSIPPDASPPGRMPTDTSPPSSTPPAATTRRVSRRMGALVVVCAAGAIAAVIGFASGGPSGAGANEAHAQAIAAICRESNTLQDERVARLAPFERKLKRLRTLPEKRDHILDETQLRLTASTDLRSRLAAAPPAPAGLGPVQAQTLRIWQRNLDRARAHRDALSNVHTYRGLARVLERVPRAAIEADATQVITGLRRLGRGKCDLDPLMPDPVIRVELPAAMSNPALNDPRVLAPSAGGGGAPAVPRVQPHALPPAAAVAPPPTTTATPPALPPAQAPPPPVTAPSQSEPTLPPPSPGGGGGAG
ncbi:MAG: hypothetical protein QOJ85_3948 [Solirubrobacteraceae bacterium]|nr:hypothetical protein [Solirubrobacteraceae bacterium]